MQKIRRRSLGDFISLLGIGTVLVSLFWGLNFWYGEHSKSAYIVQLENDLKNAEEEAVRKGELKAEYIIETADSYRLANEDQRNLKDSEIKDYIEKSKQLLNLEVCYAQQKGWKIDFESSFCCSVRMLKYTSHLEEPIASFKAVVTPCPGVKDQPVFWK